MPHGIDATIKFQLFDPLLQSRIRLLLDVFFEPIFQLPLDDPMSSPPVSLGLEGSQLPVLMNQFDHDAFTDHKPFGHFRVAAFSVFIGEDNTFTEINGQGLHNTLQQRNNLAETHPEG